MMLPSHKIQVGENLKTQIAKFEQLKGVTLTVKGIAGNVGVSPDYIRKILNGKRFGSYSVMIALAKYLECDINELIMPRS
jgi:transcriptional regulator with XRE-family HTH domain